MTKKIFLIIAALSSITAQRLLFASGQFAFIPGEMRPVLVLSLFILAFIFYFIALRSSLWGSRTDWIFLTLQGISILGLFFLLASTAAINRNMGFLLTSIFTLVTTFALYISPTPVPESVSEHVEDTVVKLHYEHAKSGDTAVLQEQVNSLQQQVANEKYRGNQQTLLIELIRQLETELDPPVSAQLAVNTLERAMECSIAALFVLDPEQHDFVVLASAGIMTSLIPSGYRQDAKTGVLGRTAKTRKTILVWDTRLDPDFVRLENETTLSTVYAPVLQDGRVKGVLEICSEKTNAFTSLDAAMAESVASELVRAWERSSYQQHITELIQAGISPNTLMMDPQASVQEVAIIARKTLDAQFVFVSLLDQQGNFSRMAFAGNAPRLLTSLNLNSPSEPLLKAALNATKPFRVRDIRKYSSPQKLDIDHSGLRCALAIPIRLHRFSIGTIIAFGKQDNTFFSEKDESLADLLSSQAAASIESSWLYQDLRSKESIYKLLIDIIESEELIDAAEKIAKSAHKMTTSIGTGVVLMNRDGQVEAEVEIDANGLSTHSERLLEIVDQAIKSGRHIIDSTETGSVVCFPLLTHKRTYGALWINLPESTHHFDFQTLANQVSMVWERSILLSESRRQAKQLEEAYDHTLKALMSALDARDRETEGHSTRVSRLACALGEKLGLGSTLLKDIERGALLHDIGKIGISDKILHKPGELDETDWMIMRMHPEIGARIVEKIPFLQQAIPVILSHHERWNGSGYPDNLKETEIPIQARIFAVADVFDALTSTRAYRKKSSPDDAMEYLRQQSGILFDPEVVEALGNLPYADFIQGNRILV